MMTFKEIRENFIRRDNQAVNDYNANGIFSIEERLFFVEQRLEDACTVLSMILKKLETL